MKLAITIKKNLKLLFRNKESAYTIVFGPILIILLVSFAFLGASNKYAINVGTYAPAQTTYSARVIDTLNHKQYVVSVYPDQDSCVASVKTGTNHACIVFSPREAGNGTIPVAFYLDMSRANIVYQISEDLAGALDLESNAIRTQLATDTLTRMQTSSILIGRDINTTSRISDRFAAITQDLAAAKQALSGLSNVTVNASDVRTLKGQQNGLAQDTRTVANFSTAAIDSAIKMMNTLDSECTDCSNETKNQVAQVRKDLDQAETSIILISEDKVNQQLFDANSVLDDTIRSLNALEAQLANDSAARVTIMTSINDAAKDAGTNARDLKQVLASMNYTKAVLDGQAVNASSISTPVTISVVSVAAAVDRLSFTYPYLLVLVIMFIGMLLASMLVVADKTSRASFRNFTTPTPDGYHIAVSFVTAFFLLLAEVTIILLCSALFVAQPLLLWTVSTIGIVCIAIILFTFIGMIIGYLSNTQEAAMIASISVGSILLFVSNLVIPIEGMASAVQSISGFNPYLVLSELLRRSTLYGVSFSQVSSDMLLLIVLCAALFVVTLFIQRGIKKRYFRQDVGLLAPHVPAPLSLGTKTLHNEVELLDALDRMTRSEFEQLVTADDNLVSAWVGKELRNHKLARQLRTTSKERMMLRLDKHMERHGRHFKR